ncbi:integrase catalytic domain-containing protein [Trichonephila clavipes]|nr:integrase catalytic domain-containing protein [Trichonephila clavipes]
MFLGESHSYSVSDSEELDSQKLSKRIKYRRKLFNYLRQWFRREYLSELIQKSYEKSSHEPKVGEMVLIGDDVIKKYTSSGRCVKTPKRLDLFNYQCYRFDTLPEYQTGGGCWENSPALNGSGVE